MVLETFSVVGLLSLFLVVGVVFGYFFARYRAGSDKIQLRIKDEAQETDVSEDRTSGEVEQEQASPSQDTENYARIREVSLEENSFALMGATKDLSSALADDTLELAGPQPAEGLPNLDQLLALNDIDPETVPYRVQTVFFGTDREPEDVVDDVQQFGHGRAQVLSLGFAQVTIPKSRDGIAAIQRPKSRLWGLLGKQAEDAAKHFTIAKCAMTGELLFHQLAAKEAEESVRFKNAAFVFVHGFNVPFRDAIFRAAQIKEDIQFDGPAFVYSWPAEGSGGVVGTANYVHDMDSAEFAAPYLDKFIDIVAKTPGVERVHVIAHSMGNQLLCQWFQEVGLALQQRNSKTIDQLILAAPDIDAELFKKVAIHMTRHAAGVTLYACATDVALSASEFARGGLPRAGDVPDDGPAIASGIDTVDISSVGAPISSIKKYWPDDRPFMDHSNYADDDRVLGDLGEIMRYGQRAADRGVFLEPRGTSAGADYWYLKTK